MGAFLLFVSGATVLSIIGGFLNGLSFSGVYRVGLTHLTGATTLAGITMVKPEANPHNSAFYWMLILVYCFGSCVAGMIVGGSRTKWGGRQSVVLTIETGVVWLAVILLPEITNLSAACIAVASGLQNGATANLEQIVLRTANVTGTVVDIGVAFGQCLLEGFSKHRWKLALWIPSFLGFWIGAVWGTLAFQGIGNHSLIVAAALLTILSIISWAISLILRHRRRKERSGTSHHKLQGDTSFSARPPVSNSTLHVGLMPTNKEENATL